VPDLTCEVNLFRFVSTLKMVVSVGGNKISIPLTVWCFQYLNYIMALKLTSIIVFFVLATSIVLPGLSDSNHSCHESNTLIAESVRSSLCPSTVSAEQSKSEHDSSSHEGDCNCAHHRVSCCHTGAYLANRNDSVPVINLSKIRPYGATMYAVLGPYLDGPFQPPRV
jgi:hypothetical protein